MKKALALALLAALVLAGCLTTRTPSRDDAAIASAEALALVQTANRSSLGRASELLAGQAHAASRAAAIAGAGRTLFADLYPELANPFTAAAAPGIDEGVSPFLSLVLPVLEALRGNADVGAAVAVRMRDDIDSVAYLSPDSVLPPYLNALIVLRTKGNVSEARDLLEETLRRSSDFYPAARRLADLIVATGNAAKEIDRLMSLAAILPSQPEQFAALTHAYTAAGQWDKAADTAAQGLLADPGDPRFALMRAGALASGGDWYQALRILEDLRKLAPGDPAATLLEARLLSEKEDNGVEALAVLESAGAARASDPDFLELRGTILLRMKRFDDAAAALKRALDAAPDRASTLSLLVAEAVAAGRWEEALSWIVRIRAAARTPDDLRGAWEAAMRRGDFGQATDFARQLVEKSPGPESSLREARALVAAGKNDDALAVIDATLAASTDAALRSELHLLRSGTGAGDPVDDLRLSLKENPDNVAALVAIADRLASQEDYRKALEYARRAAALAADDAAIADRVRDLEARAAGR